MVCFGGLSLEHRPGISIPIHSVSLTQRSQAMMSYVTIILLITILIVLADVDLSRGGNTPARVCNEHVCFVLRLSALKFNTLAAGGTSDNFP